MTSAFRRLASEAKLELAKALRRSWKFRTAYLRMEPGDDQADKQTQPWYLPAPRRKLYRWRAVQRKEFAADALLGDTDGDLVPDVLVGRIPARTAAQVKLVTSAVAAFEARQPGPNDLRPAPTKAPI